MANTGSMPIGGLGHERTETDQSEARNIELLASGSNSDVSGCTPQLELEAATNRGTKNKPKIYSRRKPKKRSEAAGRRSWTKVEKRMALRCHKLAEEELKRAGRLRVLGLVRLRIGGRLGCLK